MPGTRIYEYNTNWFITALALGDTDRDGRVELFTAFNGKSGGAAIYRSTTGLGTGPRIYGPAAGESITALAVGDLDRDGSGELYAATLAGASSSQVIAREGAGEWTVAIDPVPNAVIPALAIGRIDAGVFPDLMIALNHREGGTTILHGWRNLGILVTEPSFTSAVWRASSLAAGDTDGDGLHDLYMGFDTPAGSEIYRLDGSVAGPGTRVWSGTYWRN
jgi:hypothetical protein